MNYELSISLPTSWSELSQRQLRQVFMALAGVAPHQWMQAAARCVLRWGGFRIVCPYGRNYLISIRNTKRITRNATPPDPDHGHSGIYLRLPYPRMDVHCS